MNLMVAVVIGLDVLASIWTKKITAPVYSEYLVVAGLTGKSIEYMKRL